MNDILRLKSAGTAATAEPDLMKMLKDFLQASIVATTSQQQLVKEVRKMEKNGEKMAVMNQKAYIAWKAYCKVYRQNKGKDKMVDLIEPAMQEFCAEYICYIELNDFLPLENSDLTDILVTHSDILMRPTFTRQL